MALRGASSFNKAPHTEHRFSDAHRPASFHSAGPVLPPPPLRGFDAACHRLCGSQHHRAKPPPRGVFVSSARGAPKPAFVAMLDRGATAAAIVAQLAVLSPRQLARSLGVQLVRHRRARLAPARSRACSFAGRQRPCFHRGPLPLRFIARSRQSPRRRRRRGRVVRHARSLAAPRAPRPFVVVAVIAGRERAWRSK
jgi:hypothetical protein